MGGPCPQQKMGGRVASLTRICSCNDDVILINNINMTDCYIVSGSDLASVKLRGKVVSVS